MIDNRPCSANGRTPLPLTSPREKKKRTRGQDGTNRGIETLYRVTYHHVSLSQLADTRPPADEPTASSPVLSRSFLHRPCRGVSRRCWS